MDGTRYYPPVLTLVFYPMVPRMRSHPCDIAHVCGDYESRPPLGAQGGWQSLQLWMEFPFPVTYNLSGGVQFTTNPWVHGAAMYNGIIWTRLTPRVNAPPPPHALRHEWGGSKSHQPLGAWEERTDTKKTHQYMHHFLLHVLVCFNLFRRVFLTPIHVP